MIISKLTSFLQKYSIYNSTILIACSGGADSTALVVALSQLQKQFSLSLVVAHINYHLRGKDSDDDLLFVQNLCFTYNIPFYYEDADLSGLDSGMEDEARKVRYAFFEKLNRKLDISYVAVAHNENDQAETALFRLARGAGSRGVSAMEAVREDGVIRPLLFCSRIEIEAFLRSDKISWREDKSNSDLVYKRNLIRHQILPLLEQINPKAIEHIAQFTLLLQEDEKMKGEIIGEWLDEQTIYKSETALLLRWQEPPSFLKSALYEVTQRCKIPITQVHVAELLSLWHEKSGSRELLRGWSALMVGNALLLHHKNSLDFPTNFSFSYDIGDSLALTTGEFFSSRLLEVEETPHFDRTNRRVYLDSSLFPLICVPASTVSSITLFGTQRTASVQKLLKKASIPLWKRERFPLFLNRNGSPLWLPNVAFCELASLRGNYIVEITCNNL